MLKYTKCAFRIRCLRKVAKSGPALKASHMIQKQRHQINRGKYLFPNTVNWAKSPKVDIILARPQLLVKVKYSLQQICILCKNILLIHTNKQIKKNHVQVQQKQTQAYENLSIQGQEHIEKSNMFFPLAKQGVHFQVIGDAIQYFLNKFQLQKQYIISPKYYYFLLDPKNIFNFKFTKHQIASCFSHNNILIYLTYYSLYLQIQTHKTAH